MKIKELRGFINDDELVSILIHGQYQITLTFKNVLDRFNNENIINISNKPDCKILVLDIDYKIGNSDIFTIDKALSKMEDKSQLIQVLDRDGVQILYGEVALFTDEYVTKTKEFIDSIRDSEILNCRCIVDNENGINKPVICYKIDYKYYDSCNNDKIIKIKDIIKILPDVSDATSIHNKKGETLFFRHISQINNEEYKNLFDLEVVKIDYINGYINITVNEVNDNEK